MATDVHSGNHFLDKKTHYGLSKPEIQIDSPGRASDWDERSPSNAASPSTSSPRWKKATQSPRGFGKPSTSAGVNAQKSRQLEWVFQLQDVADGLMTKIYRLRETLELSDNESQFSDAFWRSGLFPNAPKLCLHVVKKFPEHPVKTLPEKIDRVGIDLLRDNAEGYLAALEPCLLVLLDLMTFREQALRVILDMSSTVVTLLPHQNPLVLHAFMNLFCAFVKVNLYADKIPRKMLLQMYNLTHTILKSGRDYEFYHKLVQFVDTFDPPLKGLHDDLNFVSHRVGEILDAIGPTIYLGADFERIRSEGFLSPYHPRYPDKLTNSAHPARAQELTHIFSYREWVLLGYLVCPSELLRLGAIDIVMAVLKDTLVLPLFRDEYISLHEEYQQYVLPKVSESRKQAKAGRMKQKEADVDYSFAKQVEKTILEAHEIAISHSDNIHKEHRTILTHELGRMILFFTDQPSLLAPDIQMAYAALAVARAELLWYFSHAGLVVGRAKGNRATPVSPDSFDFTIGCLLSSMEKLMMLIRKYSSAIKAFSLGFLANTGQRIRSLFESPGVIALDLESDLRNSFISVMDCLEMLPKMNEKASSSSLDLAGLRRDWLRIITIISSSRAPVNFRHLEKATICTGKESIIAEGNIAYVWSRSVDDIDKLLSQHGSLKLLRFYREHLNMVFRHTMYGPEGRPYNCCAWLGIASTFPDNAHFSVSDEPAKLAQDAVNYVETLLDSIMAGLEGLINLLDSDEGLGRLDQQLLPERAAARLNHVAKSGLTSNNKSVRVNLDVHLPGYESKPSNSDLVKLIEAVMQRLTRLCSELNEMEPVRVVNHVYVPREYMRDRILGNFRNRILSVMLVDEDLQRPSVVERCLRRHMTIIHLIEQHVGMNLTLGIREVLLKEAYTGQLRNLVPVVDTKAGSSAVSTIADWYIENIIKDTRTAGVTFAPSEKGFRAARLLGKMAANMVANKTELEAFVRIFGPYGVDKLEKELREQLSALLNCIDITLRSNKESLESLASNMQTRKDRDGTLRHVTELETLMNFSIQVGHILSFRQILTEATSSILETDAPSIQSLFFDFSKHAPSTIPEKEPVSRLKMLASLFGGNKDQDSKVVQSVLLELGGAGDSTWALVPYLYIACMTSNMWDDSNFDISTGGFNNNVHCLARCVNAVIAANELVRYERKELAKAQQRKGEEQEAAALDITEASIKTVMKTFLQGAAVITLESSELSRHGLIAKLIFLDQLCDHSRYLARSTLEAHIPRPLMRSLYQAYYENSTPTLLSQSKRQTGRNGAMEGELRGPAAPGKSQQPVRQGSVLTTSAPTAGVQAHETKNERGHSGPVDGKKDSPGKSGSRYYVSRSGPLTNA